MGLRYAYASVVFLSKEKMLFRVPTLQTRKYIIKKEVRHDKLSCHDISSR